MKTTIKTLAILFILFATPSFAAPKPSESVHVLSTKRYLFYFKVEKELIGGSVEIYDVHQNLVGTEKIVNIKTIVDFFNFPAGAYTIKIKKDAKEFDFQYVNNE